MKRRDFLQLLLLFLSGCAIPGEQLQSLTSSTGPKATPPDLAACHPAPLVVPTRPAVIPDVYQVDDVGLHATGQPVEVDPISYRLRVTGLVDNPLSLSLDELRCLPFVSQKTKITCLGVFEDTSTWAGTPFKPILDWAGVQKGAWGLDLIGADGYVGNLNLIEAMRPDIFLAYQLENGPVPVLHGFPVRAALPGKLGSAWTKWLVEIKVV